MSEQIFQIGVKGLIRNDSEQVLMVHLTPQGSSQGFWDLPGGRVTQNEDLLQTLDRELNEEIGISFIDEPILLSTFVSKITITVDDQQLPLLIIVYRVSIAQDAEIKLDPNSSEDGYGWFSPKQTSEKLKNKFSPDFCEMLAKL